MDLNNISINIGITGETGSGKSTFVNAIRGISNRDVGAAPTGVIETTVQVTPYPHPSYQNVILWDLPGIGTTMFPANNYFSLVEFRRFDFFVIISDTRFRENDVRLARAIRSMGKKFFFVRSKIDHNMRDQAASQRNFNPHVTLDTIRRSCVQGLQQQGFQDQEIFLISNLEVHLYDFPRLVQAFDKAIHLLRAQAYLYGLFGFSQHSLNRDALLDSTEQESRRTPVPEPEPFCHIL